MTETVHESIHLKRAKWLTGVGELSEGFNMTIMSVAILFIKKSFQLTAAQSGGLISAAGLGMLFGTMISGTLADRFGRRSIYVFNQLSLITIAILSALANDFTQLFALRVALGVVLGANAPVIVAYLAEISPKNKRGRFVAFTTNALQLFGAVLAAVMGIIVARNSNPDMWRWLFAMGVVPPLLVYLAKGMLPESPRWLASKGRIEEAEAAYTKLGIKTEGQVKIPTKEGIKELVAKYKGVFILVYCWGALQTLIGPFCKTAMPYILAEGVGTSIEASLMVTIFVQVTSVWGIWYGAKLTDGPNRVKTAVWSILGTGASALLLAWVGLPSKSVVLLAILYDVFVVVHWFAIPNLPKIWYSELFPTKIRGTATGVQFTALQVGQTISGYSIPVGIATVGVAWTMSAIMIPITLLLLILTLNPQLNKNQGKTAEEIDNA